MGDLMHTSNQSSKLRIIPHFGDVAMVLQLVRSKIWRELYEGSKKAYWRFFMWLLAVKIEIFAVVTRNILRHRHGRNTTGAITGLWAVSLVAAFNVQHVFGWVLTLVPFLSPLLVFILDWSILGQYLFVSVKSNLLMVLMVVFALFQLAHVIGLRIKKGRNNDASKRGDSWLMNLFPKQFTPKEIWIQAVVEPLLILGVGALGWWFFDDKVFFSFMVLSAVSLCIQELSDEMYRVYHGRI